jgi:site-specific recombinase XerC
MKIAPGIRETASGFEAYIRIKGKLRTKRFKRDTPKVQQEMQLWLELQRVSVHFKIPIAKPGERTFAADVVVYLALVSKMTTIDDRTYRMHQWAAVFGTQPRAAITSVAIRTQLERWRVDGHAKGKGLSPASLNQRRTALMHFFTMMNGKSGANPVRDVPPYKEEELPLRLPTLLDAHRAILLARHPIGPKKLPSKTQARLWVLLYTGWPSATLKRLRPTDIKDGSAMVEGRKKGKGTKPHVIPMSAPAQLALQRLAALGAFGTFSGSSVHSALQLGCKHAKLARIRPYDLRHRFATTVVAASKDERGAAELLMSNQVRRYSRQAATERAQAALNAAFGAPANSANFDRGLVGSDEDKLLNREPRSDRAGWS